MTTNQIALNPRQRIAYRARNDVDGIALGGARGGGKTYVAGVITGAHIAQYGADASCLIFRRYWNEMHDLIEECHKIWTTMFGPDAFQHNKLDHITRFTNGARVRFEQVESYADAEKTQAASFTLIWGEELGKYPSLAPFDFCCTALRAPKHVHPLIIVTMNPGGAGHSACRQRFVKEYPDLPPVNFTDEQGLKWLFCPSDARHNTENVAVDRYWATIDSGIGQTDPELALAFKFGSWDLARGAFFGSSFDESRNVIAPWKTLPSNAKIEFAGDWGTAEPAAFPLVATFPRPTEHEGHFFKAGDAVVFDEFTTCTGHNLNQGSKMGAARVAEHLTSLWNHWNLPRAPYGVLDSAAWADVGVDSPGLILAANGCRFRKSQKQARDVGWAMMHQRFLNAGDPAATGPALYYCSNAEYCRDSTLACEHHKTKREDMTVDSPDHALDGLRYLLNFKPIKRRSREFAL